MAALGCNAPAPSPSATPVAAIAYTPGGPCPGARALPADRDASCRCSGSEHGAVWGTGQYTDDSNICVAARHAGLLSAGGAGVVAVRRSPGCDRYQGTTAHGVTTSSYARWSGSFHFPGFGGPACDQQPPPTVATPPPPAAIYSCPDVLPVIGDGSATHVTCACEPPIAAGPVWGAGPYTLDSRVCAAALHAGAIDPRGGRVELDIVPGCPRYPAATGEHGVHARASEATPWAFVLTARPARCP